jgi:tRNA nucleotidyltransferase (CCA-adding enzyme)
VKIYKVGGAVRDRLLGLPVKDTDWVVVGATPEEMIANGYQQVGREFPVFLHPETKQEYALARTERKTAPGYKGFSVHAAPDVTLEDDLRRRDLTINAMAETPDGELIDPFGGAGDIRTRQLRHVSSAFSEDPVRILRVARFAARFVPLGFQVAPETTRLMQDMVEAGEVDALVPERVWTELVRSLAEEQPSQFFEVLRSCGALAVLFPEIDRLFGVPQPRQHHPEIDSGIHVLQVLDHAATLTDDLRVRFAALVHDLGKAETPADEWPKHISHEEKSVELIRSMCHRLRAPNEYRDLGILAARYHTRCHRAAELRPATLFETLESLDAFRRPERLGQFLIACEADSTSRPGFEDRGYPQADIFRKAFQAARDVDTSILIDEGYEGEQLAAELKRRRIAAIAAL